MKPHNQDDPYRRKPDITRAQELLQWSPVVSTWLVYFGTCLTLLLSAGPPQHWIDEDY